jgi:hypothetical protein
VRGKYCANQAQNKAFRTLPTILSPIKKLPLNIDCLHFKKKNIDGLQCVTLTTIFYYSISKI